MDQNDKPNITIGKVKGDVTISQDQSGGITAHSNNALSEDAPRRKTSITQIVVIIGLVSSIVTVLAYFGIKPNSEDNMNDKDDKSIVIGDVNGDVVISPNQRMSGLPERGLACDRLSEAKHRPSAAESRSAHPLVRRN